MTLAREIYESKVWYNNITVKVGNKTLFTNLIAIEMDDFNTILGIDWLSTIML